MKQMIIQKNLIANSTFIHIPTHIDHKLGLKRGEKVWIKLDGKRIIIQREKPVPNSMQGGRKHESA